MYLGVSNPGNPGRILYIYIYIQTFEPFGVGTVHVAKYILPHGLGINPEPPQPEYHCEISFWGPFDPPSWVRRRLANAQEVCGLKSPKAATGCVSFKSGPPPPKKNKWWFCFWWSFKNTTKGATLQNRHPMTKAYEFPAASNCRGCTMFAPSTFPYDAHVAAGKNTSCLPRRATLRRLQRETKWATTATIIFWDPLFETHPYLAKHHLKA